MEIENLSKLIKHRRTHYAFHFSEKIISKSVIETLIENALWAPTHKLTQPWRFAVLEGNHKQRLGQFMASYYRDIYSLDDFSEERYKETQNYPCNATLIAIICNPSTKLPEWEEIAAVSCAVQNMWLSATSLNLGAYWDTGEATIAYIKENVCLEKTEKCLGIFYLGHLKDSLEKVNRRRKPLAKKLSWQHI